MTRRILIIKLGALGDMVQATPAFAALRSYHKKNSLILLTTQPYGEFAKRLGYFDEVVVDSRPRAYQWRQWLHLIRLFRQGNFHTVYDFQGVDRTRLYRRFFPRDVVWVPTPLKNSLHPQERFLHQLNPLGIDSLPSLDLTILAEEGPVLPPRPYALLIPGASQAHGGRKRWPEEGYAEVAAYFVQKGITPVIIGGPQEAFSVLSQKVPQAINLVGKTSLYQIIGLARLAVLAVGNDTGPMLLAAAGGCPTLTFYSAVNPAAIGGPRGDRHVALERPFLKDLSVQDVLKSISDLNLFQ